MHIFYLYKGNNYKIIIKYPNVFINILQESDKILNLETVMMTVVYFGSNKSISVGEDFVLNVNGQKTQNDKKKKLESNDHTESIDSKTMNTAFSSNTTCNSEKYPCVIYLSAYKILLAFNKKIFHFIFSLPP